MSRAILRPLIMSPAIEGYGGLIPWHGYTVTLFVTLAVCFITLEIIRDTVLDFIARQIIYSCESSTCRALTKDISQNNELRGSVRVGQTKINVLRKLLINIDLKKRKELQTIFTQKGRIQIEIDISESSCC